jgi:hypothetical protein
LTTKQLIFADENSPPMPIPLETIKKVYLANDKKLAKLTNSGKRMQVVIALDKGGYVFAPKEQVTISDKIELLSRVLGNPPIRALQSQGQLAENWVLQIENAVRDKKIMDLQKDTIQAWKCKYCETLNEAEKEKCSNCGSPRRTEKT